MATLYICEYSDVKHVRSSVVQVGMEEGVTEQTVAIGGSSVQSSAFQATTDYIRVHTDAICSILIGLNPTATAAKKRLAANQTEYFGVRGGDKLAVITNS